MQKVDDALTVPGVAAPAAGLTASALHDLEFDGWKTTATLKIREGQFAGGLYVDQTNVETRQERRLFINAKFAAAMPAEVRLILNERGE